MRRSTANVWAIPVLFFTFAGFAAAGEIEPFYTRNQSPLIQIFGLPPAEGGAIAGEGKTDLRLVLDLANIFSGDSKDGEEVRLDGEIYRLTLAARRGIAPDLELGIDLPYVWHSGGRLDGFIDGFHRIFDLPEGGREITGRNRLRYLSLHDGETGMRFDEPQDGFGDLLLSVSWNAVRSGSPSGSRSITLRSALKLPTGKVEELTGSGSSDFSLRLSGSDNLTFSAWHLGWYGIAGGMLMSKGDVLPDRQRRYAAFGTLGLGWNYPSWLSLKIQLDAHTAFYRDSELCQLDSESVQATIGTAVALPWDYRFDFGVTEDLLPNTAPDVVFHFALRRQF